MVWVSQWSSRRPAAVDGTEYSAMGWLLAPGKESPEQAPGEQQGNADFLRHGKAQPPCAIVSSRHLEEEPPDGIQNQVKCHNVSVPFLLPMVSDKHRVHHQVESGLVEGRGMNVLVSANHAPRQFARLSKTAAIEEATDSSDRVTQRQGGYGKITKILKTIIKFVKTL